MPGLRDMVGTVTVGLFYRQLVSRVRTTAGQRVLQPVALPGLTPRIRNANRNHFSLRRGLAARRQRAVENRLPW